MSASLHRSTDRISLTAPPFIDDLDAEIVQLAQQLTMDTYRLLRLVADFDDRFGWARWGFRNCAEWLAYRCDLSICAAREKVRIAHALRLLPRIAAAFAAGRLSYSKVRALTRVVEAHNEEALLEYALGVTAPQVEDRCQQMRNGDLGSAVGALRAWQRRSLTLWRNQARGIVTINVELPLDQGELVAQALERAVASGECATGIEFAARDDFARDGVRDAGASMEGNGWRAQQADALVAVAKAYLISDRPIECNADRESDGPNKADAASEAPSAPNGAAGADGANGANGADEHEGDERTRTTAPPRSTSDGYQVVVHVDRSALEGHGGRSDLPIETVKRLTCDGSLITIVEDEDGHPLDVGRKRRTVTTALRRALWSRDRGCTFPGCRAKRWVQAHHIRHWANGGGTNVENCILLCSHHHTLLHEGGFGIRRADDGALRFVRGDGKWIPRCGYRLEDMQDDDRSSAENSIGAWVAALETEHTSMEAYAAEAGAYAAEGGARPHASTEVRESAGRYTVRATGHARNSTRAARQTPSCLT